MANFTSDKISHHKACTKAKFAMLILVVQYAIVHAP